MLKKEVHKMRENYDAAFLLEVNCEKDPFQQFKNWFDEISDGVSIEPNAMSLATVDAAGQPTVRTVLLKGFDERGFVFFTNYESRKGKAIADNPKVSLCFWWREQQRQVHIQGIASRISRQESEAYFKTRPRGSQIGARISQQSQVIDGRSILEYSFEDMERAFADKEIPMPDNWGGYLVAPEVIEFWQGRESRLHDRIQYRKSGNGWILERLAP